MDYTHNHDPTQPEAHPLLRQLTTEDVAFIANEPRRRIDPHLTTSELRARQPDRPIKKKDVYNARTKIRVEKGGKYTRIQALLNELSENDWMFEWDVDDISKTELDREQDRGLELKPNQKLDKELDKGLDRELDKELDKGK